MAVLVDGDCLPVALIRGKRRRQRGQDWEQRPVACEGWPVRRAIPSLLLRAGDGVDGALQQSVIGRVLGDTLDRLGLDAAEQAGRPVRYTEGATGDAVDVVGPAVEQPEVCAAIAAAAAGRVAVEVGEELGHLV